LGVHAEKSFAAVLEASFCAHPQKTFLCALSVTHNRENENFNNSIEEERKRKKREKNGRNWFLEALFKLAVKINIVYHGK
jgi:hypothetical protein